jgi:hypothetical protein
MGRQVTIEISMTAEYGEAGSLGLERPSLHTFSQTTAPSVGIILLHL